MGRTNTRQQPGPIGEWRDYQRPKLKSGTHQPPETVEMSEAGQQEKKNSKKTKRQERAMGWHPGPWDTTLKGNLEILNFEVG